MIIIEGSDLVGKTTLCNTLVQHPALEGYWYHHLNRPPKNFDGCQAYMEMAFHNYVQDRYHMSEPVYARMRGDTPSIDPERYRLVDAHLRLLGALIVIIVSETELLQERYKMRNEMYNLGQILLVNEYFEQITQEKTFYDDYIMDWDIVIHCDAIKPYPDVTDVKIIIAAYKQRQAILYNAMGDVQRGPQF